jgi:hypothetical protein
MSKTQTRMVKAKQILHTLLPQSQQPARQQEQPSVQTSTLPAVDHHAHTNQHRLNVTNLLSLQRTVGNRQVQRMLASRRERQAVTPMPSGTDQMVQMMRFAKWAGWLSWQKVERDDKELTPDEKKLRTRWLSYRQRFTALGATYQTKELLEQHTEIEKTELLAKADLSPVINQLDVFLDALKRQEEVKQQHEAQERQDKLEKEFVRLRQEVTIIDQWLSQKAGIVPDKLLARLATRIAKHVNDIQGLPDIFTASESHRVQPFMEAAKYTVEQVFPHVQSGVGAWEKTEAAALETLQKDRAQRLADLDQQHIAAERSYEDADSIIDVLDEIEHELAIALRDDTLAAEIFEKKVDDWIVIYNKLKAEHANRDHLANEAFKAQQQIAQKMVDAKSQLTGRPTTRNQLESDINLIVNTQKTVETLRGQMAKFTEQIRLLDRTTEDTRKTFYYKMATAEERRSKTSTASGKATAVHTVTAVYAGHDYMLIPNSANVYGRITATVPGAVKPLFTDAMTRGIIATYGRGQSGVKMRSAASYEIKVRRTNLEAKQASGVLRIENKVEPVKHDGKLFVTFNHAFEAH